MIRCQCSTGKEAAEMWSCVLITLYLGMQDVVWAAGREGNPDHLAETSFAWILHCKLTVSPLVTTKYFGRERAVPEWFLWCVFSMCIHVLSHFSCVQLFATQWTVGHHAPLSMRFSRQEYWSWLPCPPAGNLPHPGIFPTCLYTCVITLSKKMCIP